MTKKEHQEEKHPHKEEEKKHEHKAADHTEKYPKGEKKESEAQTDSFQILEATIGLPLGHFVLLTSAPVGKDGNSLPTRNHTWQSEDNDVAMLEFTESPKEAVIKAMKALGVTNVNHSYEVMMEEGRVVPVKVKIKVCVHLEQAFNPNLSVSTTNPIPQEG